ncbi:MAG: ABC transporter substrate-binding protein [Conexivisphaera sp.]
MYIGQDTEMGQDFLAGFNMSLYQNGWQNDVDLVDVMFYPAGNTQFQSILTAAATYHPQVLLLGTWTNEQAALSEQAAEIPQLKGVVQIGNAIDDDPSFYGPARAMPLRGCSCPLTSRQQLSRATRRSTPSGSRSSRHSSPTQGTRRTYRAHRSTMRCG